MRLNAPQAAIGQAALAELRRVAPGPLQLAVLDADVFQARLTEAFNDPARRAASMVDDLEESADLARLLEEMPDIEDLLEAEEDAPVIRLINTLLTEALRENAARDLPTPDFQITFS